MVTLFDPIDRSRESERMNRSGQYIDRMNIRRAVETDEPEVWSIVEKLYVRKIYALTIRSSRRWKRERFGSRTNPD